MRPVNGRQIGNVCSRETMVPLNVPSAGRRPSPIRWNLWKTQGSFRGGSGLIYGPNDIYGPIVIYMNNRVIGVGTEAFDDGVYPDSAKKNIDTITLEAETH